MAEADNLEQEPVLPENLFYPKDDESELQIEQSDEESVKNQEEDKPDEEQEAEESEESEEPEEDHEESEEESYEYIELDGREITLNELTEWEQAHKDKKSMQKDYTQKTQAAADTQKDADAKMQNAESLLSEFTDKVAKLEVLVAEFEMGSDELTELEEDDPAEYLRVTRAQEKRQKALDEAKQGLAPRSDPSADKAEQDKLLKVFPEWVSEDKYTDEFEADRKLVEDYASDKGWELKTLALGGDHRNYVALVDAARMHAKSKGGSALKKKVKAAPVMSKPKKTKQKKTRTAVDVFYGK